MVSSLKELDQLGPICVNSRNQLNFRLSFLTKSPSSFQMNLFGFQSIAEKKRFGHHRSQYYDLYRKEAAFAVSWTNSSIRAMNALVKDWTLSEIKARVNVAKLPYLGCWWSSRCPHAGPRVFVIFKLSNQSMKSNQRMLASIAHQLSMPSYTSDICDQSIKSMRSN
jgi:hypothetical protein